jgi:UDP:flavonoid glycosyltransferase YjiC (YdhE family)
LRTATTFVLVSLGTLGDLDPLLALGLELRARGGRVTVGVAENLCKRVQETGFEAAAICGDLSGMTANPLAGIMEIRKSMARQMAVLETLSEGASVVLGSGFPMGSPTIAELRKVPYLYVAVSPSYLPEAGLLPYIGLSAPAWICRLGWAYQGFSNNAMFAGGLNTYRAAKGMPRTGPVFRAVFQPERRMVAAPKELAGEAGLFAPGFLRMPSTGEIPAEVARFLDAGEPPVVIAFGSSRIAKARELTLTLVEAARACGRRTLLASSWSDADIGELPSDVCRAPYVPYSLLFERAALAIHHGGAGTFALALAAGIPQATLPGFADQSFWARKAFELGVSPSPLPRKKATKETASVLVRDALTKPTFAKRAAEVAATVVAENGVSRAADWVEEALR